MTQRRAVRDLHPAAQRDRRTAPRSRHVRQHGRPDDPLPPHEGLLHAVGARQRPCRHRHAVAGGEDAAQRRHFPRRDRARGVRAPHLGMEAQIRRHHHEPDPPPGRLLRLGARALHPGRGPVARSARSLCPALREGTDLPRPASDQLVAGPEDRRLRPGSGIQRGRSHAVLLQVYASCSGRAQHRPSEGEYIPVATIRPETILGDTAVAVHPEDERYQKFIGKTVIVPILGREIPVIADEYVSREFGTGALKITPGHDPNDYDIAQRHNLPVISMLDTGREGQRKRRPVSGSGPLRVPQEYVGGYARRRVWSSRKSRTPPPSRVRSAAARSSNR